MLADAEGRVLRVAGAVGAERPYTELDPAVVGESVSGLALEEGRALLIEDVARDERTRAWVRRPGYRSSCVVLAPILGDQGPIGVLCATDRVGASPFDDEDVSLLRVLALQLSGLLAPVLPVMGADAPSEADLCAELAQEICDAATNEIEPNQVLAGTLRPIQRLLAARVAAIHLIDGRTGELVMESGRDAGETGDRTRLPRDQGLTGVTLQTGQLIATTDPASDPRFDPEVDTPEDGRVGPVILAPLKLRGRVLGVARIFTDMGAGAPVRVGEILSSGLSAAVRNALLYRSLLESIDDLAEARREGADIKRP